MSYEQSEQKQEVAAEPVTEQPAEAPAEQPPAEIKTEAPQAQDHDLQAQIEALQAQLQEAEAKRLAIAKEAEDKIKGFQDSFGAEREKVAGELASQYQALAQEREKLAAQNEQIAAQQWSMTLDKMGVMDAYKDMIPKIDISTKEGQAKLEKFIEERPAIIKKKPVDNLGFTGSMSQKLKDIMSGKTQSAFLTKESIAKTMNS